MKLDLSKIIVRFADSSVDQDASVSAFAEALALAVESESTLTDRIHNAVHGVFDSNKPGLPIPSPTLVSLAMQKLNASVDEYKDTAVAVHEYIKANSTDGGAFSTTKGKGNGVRRLADVPPEAPKVDAAAAK